jgi:predicted acyltransferase
MTLAPGSEPASAVPNTTATNSPGRLESLDALRGFDMFWIAGGGMIGGALNKFGPGTLGEGIGYQLQHVPWEGFRFEDLIFPMFVFIAGVSIVFSVPKMIEREGVGAAIRRILTRTLVLFVIGVFFSGGFARGLDQVRWLGVLQRIALAYGGASLLFIWLKPRGLIVACLTLLLGYWALLALYPVPEFGAGDYAEGHNLTNYIDKLHLPGRKYDGDHDPEGLLSTLPAIGSCLLGVFAGLWLRGSTPNTRKALGLALAGALLLGIGWLWSPWFPVIKKLWTSSFVLVAAGWSAILLSAFYWIIEIQGWRRWAAPFVWIGLNPITIYLAGSIIDWPKLAARFTGGDLQKRLNQSVHVGTGDLLTALVGVGFCILLAWFLHKRRIYLRV